MSFLKAGVLALTLAMGAATALAQPAAEVKASAVAGPGLHVRDITAMQAWYEAKLGMKLIQGFDREGKPLVRLMGIEGDDVLLALYASGQRPEGPNRYSWVMIRVADPKAFAARMASQGVAMREVIPDVSYFIEDPEGNSLEIVRLRPPE